MRELIILKINKVMNTYSWTEFKNWFGMDKVYSFKYMTDEQILDYYTEMVRQSSMPRAG